MHVRSPHRRIMVMCLLGTVLSGSAPAAAAGQAPPGSGAGMHEVIALADLPAQIRSDLGVGQENTIADRGGPFNPGCVMVAGKPNQRFMLAALGAASAVVAVEYGGIAHGASSREYQLTHGDWTLVRTGHLDLQVAGQKALLDQHARSARAVPVKKKKWF